MTCKSKAMPRRVSRKRVTKKTRSFGSVRRARATREYVQTPMARGTQRKRIAYGAKAAAQGMMPCTRLYAKSILDPSGEESKGACLPAGFPMPSQKIRVFTRGIMYAQPNNTTLATSSNCIGYILWRPVLANDVSVITYTNSSLPSGAVSEATAFNSANWSVTSVNMTKIPYASSTMVAPATVQGRLVSGCIRIRYAGQEDFRSGIVSLFEDPDHLGVETSSVNGISLFDSCGKQRPFGDGGWHQINWSGPCFQNETEYRLNNGVALPGVFANTTHVIAISGVNPVTAGASSGLMAVPFEWECWQNMEYMGRDVVGKTNNMLDEQGAKNVFNAAKVAQSQSEPLNPTSKSASVFRDELRRAFAPKAGGTFVGNALQSLATGIHPGLGAAWGLGRSAVNAAYRARHTR